MLKVTMLKAAQGSPDHLKVIAYRQGETYDIPDFLAKAFVEEMKVAEYAGRRAAAEAKMEQAAPENKMATEAAEAKSETNGEELPAVKKAPARRL